MDYESVKNLPGKVVFSIWLRDLYDNKSAWVSKKSNSVIELGANASSLFVVGRRVKNNKPIISMPLAMIPWFFSINIREVYICNRSSIVLGFGSETIDLYLNIKIDSIRAGVLSSLSEVEEIDNTVDFHCHSINHDGTLSVGKPLHRCKIVHIKDISEITSVKEIGDSDDEIDYSTYLDEDFDISDSNNFETIII